MKILLLNDNPVVNKLVTLSAQKTSDDLDVVDDIENIVSDKYDLVIVDDTKYYNHLFKELRERIRFNKSLYLHSRDSEGSSDFTKTLKKPFLPTDLVDLFLGFAKESNILEEEEELNLDEFDLDDSDDEEISIDDLSKNDDELSLDNWDLDKDNDELELDDDTTLEDGVLDEIALLDEEDSADEELTNDDFLQSILDKDEIHEVQGLLEDTDSDFNEDEFNFEDSEDSKEELSDLDDLDENLNDEDLDKFLGEDIETVEDNSDDSAIKESELESFEDDFTQDSENTIELSSDFTSNTDFEDEIQNEVDKLSEEDLQSEVDEDILPDITESEMDEIDSLTSRDLKLAIGEEIDDIDNVPQKEESIEEDIETKIDETKSLEKNDYQNDGVESMKKLLNALLDKDIAASMKDMKIEIKITLGGKS